MFDYLTELEEKKQHPFDFIILDPPAFTKSSHTVKSAFRGYKEINLKAMKLLPRGGRGLMRGECAAWMNRKKTIL